MKIGLIGNMNNNNFAMMRYFRDLGADAHLLLYSNDGTGCLSHFTPEADTWEIERWKPFIHRTAIANSAISGFEYPTSSLIWCWTSLRQLLRGKRLMLQPVSKASLHRTFDQYEGLIGSGMTPALLLRIGRRLDLFYPYASGVEFVGEPSFASSMRGFVPRVLIHRALRRKQIHGLRAARSVVCTDAEITGGALSSIGVRSTFQTIPMLYTSETLPLTPPTSVLADAVRRVEASGISILHHARLMWKQPRQYSAIQHLETTKNSDWLFHAFAKLVAVRPHCSPQLLVVEYGVDIDATKALVSDLGIGQHVTWLPKMSRKELMWLLKRVSLGVGEFMNPRHMIWGGTGWEVLAAGKPLLQGFRFEEGEFQNFYGYPPPPLLPVRSQADVLEGLLFAADHPERAAQMGQRAREWFDTHNGISLAKKWLALVTAA